MLANKHLLLPGAHVLMDRRFVHLAAQKGYARADASPVRKLPAAEVQDVSSAIEKTILSATLSPTWTYIFLAKERIGSSI